MSNDQQQFCRPIVLPDVPGEVLPVIVDKNNHGWDGIRYGLDGHIQNAGGLGVWAKLAEK